MVPKGWKSVYLNDISEKIMVGIASAATHAYCDDGIRMLRNLNIKDGWIDDSDILFVNEEYEKQHKNKRLKTGDILTVRTGYPGVSAVVPEKYNNAQCFTSLITRLNTSNALPAYICRFINSEYGKKYITSGEAGGAQKNVNAAILKKMRIPLPPLLEQQKIGNILSTWDKAISITERLIENSTQQKEALMQQLLTGKKRLLDESGKRFEKKWEEVELGEISHITTGSSNREDSSLTGEYAFFDRSIDVRTSGIFLFDAEAIIVGGEGQDFVPKYFEGKFDLHQRTYAIMDFKNAYGKFLFYYIGYYRHYFLSQAVGSTVKSLRLPMFQKMPIKLPSVKEQQKIATVLTNADKEIELLEQQLADLQQEKKALMQVLLTGKKRVVVDGEA